MLETKYNIMCKWNELMPTSKSEVNQTQSATRDQDWHKKNYILDILFVLLTFCFLW